MSDSENVLEPNQDDSFDSLNAGNEETTEEAEKTENEAVENPSDATNDGEPEDRSQSLMHKVLNFGAPFDAFDYYSEPTEEDFDAAVDSDKEDAVAVDELNAEDFNVSDELNAEDYTVAINAVDAQEIPSFDPFELEPSQNIDATDVMEPLSGESRQPRHYLVESQTVVESQNAVPVPFPVPPTDQAAQSPVNEVPVPTPAGPEFYNIDEETAEEFEEPQRTRRWPWILLGCAIALAVGGAAFGSSAIYSAASNAVQQIFNGGESETPNDFSINIFPLPDTNNEDSGDSSTDTENPDDSATTDRDDTNSNGLFGIGGSTSDEPSSDSTTNDSSSSSIPAEGDEYTMDEILSEFNTDEGRLNNNDEAGPGAYIIGETGSLDPGITLLEGSETTLNHAYVFTPVAGSSDTYELVAPLEYLGDYFVNLSSDDVLVYEPGSSSLVASAAPLTAIPTSTPLKSGMYRVGIDIDPGTYRISEASSAPSDAVIAPGAFVYDDLSFSSSPVQVVQLNDGQTSTVTVRDGQYLELFAANATDTSSSSSSSSSGSGTSSGSSGSSGSSNSSSSSGSSSSSDSSSSSGSSGSTGSGSGSVSGSAGSNSSANRSPSGSTTVAYEF